MSDKPVSFKMTQANKLVHSYILNNAKSNTTIDISEYDEVVNAYLEDCPITQLTDGLTLFELDSLVGDFGKWLDALPNKRVGYKLSADKERVVQYVLAQRVTEYMLQIEQAIYSKGVVELAEHTD